MSKNDKKIVKKEQTNIEQFEMLNNVKAKVKKSVQRWNLIASYIKRFKPKGGKNLIAINGYIMNQLPEDVIDEIKVIIDTNLFISFLIGKRLKKLKDYLINSRVLLVFSEQNILEMDSTTISHSKKIKVLSKPQPMLRREV